MRIPIKKPRDGIVATVEFSRNGVSIVSQNQKYSEATNIRMAVENFADLSRMDIITDSGIVKYWEGFYGWLAGLLLVLPSIGLEIDNAHIVWPETE
jgi:hypothetical protein